MDTVKLPKTELQKAGEEVNQLRPMSPEGKFNKRCDSCGYEAYHEREDCPSCGKGY